MLQLPILQLNHQIQELLRHFLLQIWQFCLLHICILRLEIQRVLPGALDHLFVNGVNTRQMVAVPIIWRETEFNNFLYFQLFIRIQILGRTARQINYFLRR